MPGFFTMLTRSPILNRLRSFLRQGITPNKLALCLALGICLSCCPVLGITTSLCIITALTLRLNLPAIQLANYAATPLQLILLLPFIRMGERLFQSEKLPLSVREITARFHTSFWGTLKSLWTWEWHAVVAWIIVAIPGAVVFTLLLRAILSRMAPNSSEEVAAAEG
jgi:uncharacterized protein (DUF2062 family)